MPPAGSQESRGMNGYPEETAYPSRTIAYQAAGMITSIIEALQVHDQLRYTPAFIVYSLFSALIMHVYQMRSSNQTIVSATQQRLTTCMTALRDVSKVWLVAKMVHTLFESILGNKVLEERLQKAAGRKHNKHKQNGLSGSRTAKNTPPNERAPQQGASDHTKRKFDEMELGYVNGPPAAQMSYERSRPQSPVISPTRDLPGQAQQGAHHQQIPAISTSSPPVRHSTDAFMGTSRVNTRPTTPFNGFSYPGTPPDLFLHTRGSPKISEDLWQNYDPGQLFPPEANGMGMGLFSPGEGMVDPALRQPTHSSGGMNMSDAQSMQSGQQLPTYHQDPQGWAQLQANLQATQQHQQRPDDQWSTGSSTGPIVPTTLNVGDWFEFFGIPNGDINALNAGAGLANMVQQANGGGGGAYG
ncbi:Transcriptional activator of fatty acid utilization [Elasticomyces elasticus]|uniref:Transcriptional activator of fatty acid utilization n=1 Tax=Elasticomyces elasticus TaxID=574655 RepID=A0AAN7VR97_9PEZI|nr:Transcriptional activator of fatty acid utilization [Elasticomyces elasticus]KAK3662765.1 Transcriptional activator of fatty acid utilization [Elasticomyces elasticus]KAK4959970.1 Transcriptional activator of fatty acid utilization [Elasticomyces elasticus]KAK4967802.1 Transcriptional activator of fatty acid utilization [Elasticomyces elasticus]KAK5699625.1 Transcriptional activator of fatty acid utilization [Elasticomyces elasticus]